MTHPKKPANPPPEPKRSRTHAPPGLAPIEWQRALRRQFGREQAFGLENIGSEPFFSEFRASNPEARSTYYGAIRRPACMPVTTRARRPPRIAHPANDKTAL